LKKKNNDDDDDDDDDDESNNHNNIFPMCFQCGPANHKEIKRTM